MFLSQNIYVNNGGKINCHRFKASYIREVLKSGKVSVMTQLPTSENVQKGLPDEIFTFFINDKNLVIDREILTNNDNFSCYVMIHEKKNHHKMIIRRVLD